MYLLSGFLLNAVLLSQCQCIVLINTIFLTLKLFNQLIESFLKIFQPESISFLIVVSRNLEYFAKFRSFLATNRAKISIRFINGFNEFLVFFLKVSQSIVINKIYLALPNFVDEVLLNLEKSQYKLPTSFGALIYHICQVLERN